MVKDLVGSVALHRWAWAASLGVCHASRAVDPGDAEDRRVAAAASFAGGDPHRVYLSRLLHPLLRPRRPHHRRLPCRQSPEGPCARVRRHTTQASAFVHECARPCATLTY